MLARRMELSSSVAASLLRSAIILIIVVRMQPDLIRCAYSVSANLARRGIRVSMVFTASDAVMATPIPYPAVVRKSRHVRFPVNNAPQGLTFLFSDYCRCYHPMPN